MSVGRGSKNNVLAGLFVLGAIALTVTVIIVMSNLGERFTPMNSYIVRFSVIDGAEGLDKGAAVKIGGQRVGRVTETRIESDPLSGEPVHVDVTIQIPKRFRLYTDADVQLLRPLLGTGSTINIISFSGTSVAGNLIQGPPQPLRDGDMIWGRMGPPGFIAPSDYTKFQAILARVDRITADVEPRVGTIMDDASAAVANVRSITAEASGKWTGWSGQISTVIDRVEKNSASFDTIVNNVTAVSQSVKDGVEEARQLIARGRAVVDDNKANIDAAILNVKEFTQKANGEWARQVTVILDRGAEALDAAKQTAGEARDLIIRNSSQLDDIVANAALAAQQLKLATVEIRASPWRLLYQPTKKELENELLYNSVRQYSDAVGELKAAADALKSVSQRAQAGGSVDQSTVNAMTAKLREAFEQYQQQEKAFLQRWSQTDPQGGNAPKKP